MSLENLKSKTIDGISWSFLEGFFGQGLFFIVGIILARLLSPREFGLIGMTTIFIAISQTFVDSGFSSALIRKTDCDDKDFSTVFYFNILISLLFATIVFFSAGIIAEYFRESELRNIVQVLSIGIIINSLGTIQQIILTKNLDFKPQTIISIISSVISGAIGISFALLGFGVWSLVYLTLTKYFVNTLLFWLHSDWRPKWVFSKKSFYELFSFGSKILASSLLNTLYEQIYFIIIGKYYSASTLGQYTRADQFKNLPTQQLTNIISKVSYPVFSKVQNDISVLKSTFVRVLRTTMFLTFLLIFGLAAISQNLILSLLGSEWEASIAYLQLLCFVGVLYPLHALNLNILLVKGRSDLFLKLEIIKKILGIPVIFIAIAFNIKLMIIGMVTLSVITFFFNAYWTGKVLNYKWHKQLKDILPSFSIGLSIGLITYILGNFLHYSEVINLVLQIGVGSSLLLIIGELRLSNDYIYLKELMKNKLKI